MTRPQQKGEKKGGGGGGGGGGGRWRNTHLTVVVAKQLRHPRQNASERYMMNK